METTKNIDKKPEIKKLYPGDTFNLEYVKEFDEWQKWDHDNNTLTYGKPLPAPKHPKIIRFCQICKCEFLSGKIAPDGKMGHATMYFKQGEAEISIKQSELSFLSDHPEIIESKFHNKLFQTKGAVKKHPEIFKPGTPGVSPTAVKIAEKLIKKENKGYNENISFDERIAILEAELKTLKNQNNSVENHNTNKQVTTLSTNYNQTITKKPIINDYQEKRETITKNLSKGKKWITINGIVHLDDYEDVKKINNNVEIGTLLREYLNKVITDIKNHKNIDIDDTRDDRQRNWGNSKDKTNKAKVIGVKIVEEDAIILKNYLKSIGKNANSLIKSWIRKEVN